MPTELEVAEQIRDGQLPSPTQLGGMALFAIRITGTGMSYRPAHDEYVWRSPDHYLTDEFLARSMGLPVIWQHPQGSLLNSDEFADRVIGTVMLPYIKDDSVWAICRIYDAKAIEQMSDEQLSTSPAVVFKKTDGNQTVTLDGGKSLLVEGKPSFLDHVAICEQGVWDAGGPPTGIQNDLLEDTQPNLKRTDSMTDKPEGAAEEGRADADAGSKLDKILAHFDSLSARMDAFEEKARQDAVKADAAKADAAKKDAAKKDEFPPKAKEEEDCKSDADEGESEAEEKKEKEEGETEEVAADKKRKDAAEDKKADAKRKDSKRADDDGDAGEETKMDARVDSATAKLVRDLQAKVAAMEAAQRPLADEDRNRFAAEQARADQVYTALGDRAPAPMSGETVGAYVLRLARPLQKHSKDWGKVNLARLAADQEAFEIAKASIYRDAVEASKTAMDLQPGQLREIIKTTPHGSRIHEFVGNGTFISQFRAPSRRVSGFNTKFGA